jgi:hypothetical protein
MIAEKFIRIARGSIKAMIPVRSLHKPSPTGGTTDSRYCYAAWLRHLILLNKYKKGVPAAVAELGPGDSLGTGIAALLSGSEKYIGLDVFTYGNAAHNVKIFDELVILFKNKTPVPDAAEHPCLKPYLDNYDFPAHILTEEILAVSLAAERLAAIRKELASPAASNIFVNYFVPWKADDVKNESIDFIFSQAVVQYTDMDLLYHSMSKWLKPGGMMAHVIDFGSLGSHSVWNGHWAYTAFEWKLFSLGKKMLINRAPVSVHKEYLVKYHFSLLNIVTYKKEEGLHQNQLSKEFRHLANDDVETHIAYMLSAKVN